MTRTPAAEPETMSARQRMIANIRGHNRLLPTKHLEQMTEDELLANCHPTDRIDFKKRLNLQNLL